MKPIYIFLLISSLGYISLNAQEDSDRATLEQTIRLSKANHIKALINVSGGEININGTTNELAEVSFNYDKNEWNPSVSFTEEDKVGRLMVKAKTEGNEKKLDKHNVCNIQLNNKLVYSFGMVMGVGLANINLAGYHVEKALFRLGVGSFTVNLANTSISNLKVEAGIGEATFDLSGKRKTNLKAEVTAGIGELQFIVPSDVGVKFTISGFLGDIQAPGFNKDGKVYTNAAYENSSAKMEFVVSGAIGSIEIVQK